MPKIELMGPELPNIPWEERPPGCSEVVWRSARNPIITRDAVPDANSIFNSAVVRFEAGFAGVFRCDNTARVTQLHADVSQGGIQWDIEPERIHFRHEDEEIGRLVYGYDPRVCWLEGRHYVTLCNGYHGPTIGVGYTHHFTAFTQMENAFLPITETVCFSLARSAGNAPCSAARATRGTRRLATYSTVKAQI